MATIREWLNRLRGTLRRTRTERDLEEELRLHLELAAEDARRRGDSPARAVRAARIEAGGVAHAMDELRDQRGLPWLEDLACDLRYACRMLAGNPGFTIVSVLSLAIGIGANCAVFSWADALLLRPLTVPRPAEVVTVGSTDRLWGTTPVGAGLVASYADYVDLRDRASSFDGLVASTNTTVAFGTSAPSAPSIAGSDTLPRPRLGLLVSSNFFQAMRVEPQLGRAFLPEEGQVPGRDAVVVLGHDFWEQQFGADPSVVGRTVRLNGIEFTVIGVSPAGFTGLDQHVRFEFYAPLMMWPRLIGDSNVDPNTDPIRARDLRGVVIYRMRTITILNVVIGLVAALGAMGLGLAIVGLYGFVAYAARRRTKEIGIRMAIGADRATVLRMVLRQGLVLASAGLGVGVLASAAADRALGAMFPGGSTREGRIDVVAFLLVASGVLAVTLVAAYVPARRASRVSLTDALRHE